MTFSYKHYLEVLDQKHSSIISKLLITVAVIIFITTGTISALFYKYQKEAPERQQYQYLKTVESDFHSSSQALGELLEAFSVAGVKVTKIDTLAESSQSASGFFVALDDVEKNLAKIEATRANLEEKQINLSQKNAPIKLIRLHDQIQQFYSEAQTVLSDLYQNHLFAKKLLLATGPEFYVPSLTEGGLWDGQSKEQVLNYYESAKAEANAALSDLAKLSPPDHFKSYYDSQIAYLTILVNLSDNIINTLSVSDDRDSESATQIEKAYQLLVGARRENEEPASKLLAEKLKIVDVPENLNKLSVVQIRINSIKENLDLAASITPKIEEPDYMRFLQGLQTPSIIW